MSTVTGARAFIDTHVHFWDLKHPELTYGWLAPDAIHPILGNIDPIKSVRFDSAALWAEARFTGLAGAVPLDLRSGGGGTDRCWRHGRTAAMDSGGRCIRFRSRHAARGVGLSRRLSALA